MSNASINGILCPVCGETINVSATIDPGSPGTWEDPPEGPELIETEPLEFNCDCRKKIEENGSFKVFDRWVGSRQEGGSIAVYREVNELLDAYDKTLNLNIDNSNPNDWEFYDLEPLDDPRIP